MRADSRLSFLFNLNARSSLSTCFPAREGGRGGGYPGEEPAASRKHSQNDVPSGQACGGVRTPFHISVRNHQSHPQIIIFYFPTLPGRHPHLRIQTRSTVIHYSRCSGLGSMRRVTSWEWSATRSPQQTPSSTCFSRKEGRCRWRSSRPWG
jgi:hypothetical protein